MINIKQPLINVTFNCDHIKELIILTSDYIRRISLYYNLKPVLQK